MDSEDGELFIKQLATFVRTHEKALANALQFRRQTAPRHGASQSVSSLPTSASSPTLPERPSTSSSTTSSLAAALSLGALSFTSHSAKSTKLSLTPHHLFYLLSRFEDLGIAVGPMGVRIENIHDAAASTNYVSFLSQSQRSKSRGSDVGSIRSVSSMRSVMSSMSSMWASFGLGSTISAARTERQKAALQADLKYLYSAFTKIPYLRLAPDSPARLIRGYEEFPFDSAVPLYAFKNVQALEVCEIDFRQFFGWDRLADQLRSLTLKRAHLDDPAEILIDIVLDDMEKRRRRTSKTQTSPHVGPMSTGGGGFSSSPRRGSPSLSQTELLRSMSMPGSPNRRNSVLDMRIGTVLGEHILDEEAVRHSATDTVAPGHQDDHRSSLVRSNSDDMLPKSPPKSSRPRSHSPRRPSSSRNGTAYVRSSHKVHRSGSGSSHSSLSESFHNRRGSVSNLLTANSNTLPSSKWRFLKYLSLADNSLTAISASSLAPLANTLHSLDLSTNLFTQIPDSLATLTALRALNLSHCMIESLHSLTHFPLPAITALNLRANRLQSIAGIERLYPLERLDLRENGLTDPMELARLTDMPDIREVWVAGNPFTRTHKDYRITIFNVFRKTPGFTEDIIIDATGPSYYERKSLVERAPLPPMVPVVKPPPVATIQAVDVSKPAIIYDTPREAAVLRKERPSVRSVSTEGNTNASRRKRAPKRRIVDLVTNDTTARPTIVPVPGPGSASVPTLAASSSNARVADWLPEVIPEGVVSLNKSDTLRVSQSDALGVQQPTATRDVPRLNKALPEPPQSEKTVANVSVEVEQVKPLHTNATAAIAALTTPPQSPTKIPASAHTPVRTPTGTSVGAPVSGAWKSPQDWDVGGELYKRKIEALRDQVGDGYLSALSEEAWDPARHTPQYHDNPFNTTTSPIHTSPIVPRPASVQAIHSGRTLG